MSAELKLVFTLVVLSFIWNIHFNCLRADYYIRPTNTVLLFVEYCPVKLVDQSSETVQL